MKDYARKRNRFDLNEQHSSKSERRASLKSSNVLFGGDSANVKSKRAPAKNFDLDSTEQSQGLDARWLFFIGIAMLVLFFLLMISMKIVSNVEKTHQKVKSTPKEVSQPEFDFYSMLSNKPISKSLANDKSLNPQKNTESKPDVAVGTVAAVSKPDESKDISTAKNIEDKKQGSALSNGSNASEESSGTSVALSTKSEDVIAQKSSSIKKKKVRLSLTPSERMQSLKLSAKGPYHIVIHRFKDYKSANAIRAELILKNVMAVIERKGRVYQVALPPAGNKTELKGQMEVLASVGVVDYRVS